MNLSALEGNPRLKAQLAQQMGGEGLSHAYIIAGRPGTGRHRLAKAMAAAALCTTGGLSAPCGQCPQCKKAMADTHPDVISVGEDKALLVDEIRDLRSDVYIRPNEGIRKIYILWNSDKMKEQPQNALLKVVEEGPSYALFLLMADNEGGILPTLRSRSELLSLAPAPEAVDEGLLGLVRPIVSAIAKGDELASLQAILALEKLDKEKILPFISLLQSNLISAATSPSGGKNYLVKGAKLCNKIQEGARQNVSGTQLFHWFVAEIFSS